MKQRVITVHGINSDGRWQAEIRKALEPHFTCVEIRYSDYRNLGLVSLVLEPRSLLTLLVVSYLLAFAGALSSPLLFVVPVLFLIVAYILATLRRRQAIDRFRSDLSKIGDVRPSLRPHLIAHDFGTYLAGWALMRPPRQFDRVILAGAVLPAWYNWAKLFNLNPGAFSRLRNEVGRRDWAAWLTLLTFPLCMGLGCSGVLGFSRRGGRKPAAVEIHRVESPYGPCPNCRSSAVAVDNVRIQEVTRRDEFIKIDHAETFWLPFLWGIEPLEYQDFVRICSVAWELQRENLEHPDLRTLGEELGERPWAFLGRTLHEEIRERVGELELRDIAYAVQLIWRAMGEALEERRAERPDDQVLLALKPQVAIARAVDVLLNHGTGAEPG